MTNTDDIMHTASNQDLEDIYHSILGEVVPVAEHEPKAAVKCLDESIALLNYSVGILSSPRKKRQIIQELSAEYKDTPMLEPICRNLSPKTPKDAPAETVFFDIIMSDKLALKQPTGSPLQEENIRVFAMQEYCRYCLDEQLLPTAKKRRLSMKMIFLIAAYCWKRLYAPEIMLEAGFVLAVILVWLAAKPLQQANADILTERCCTELHGIQAAGSEMLNANIRIEEDSEHFTSQAYETTYKVENINGLLS